MLQGAVTNAINIPSIAPEKLIQFEPYLQLARKLGKLLGLMCDGALSELSVGLYGRAAELETRPITSAALVGLLQDHLSVSINRVNANYIARRQGINVTELSSADSRDYLTMLRVSGVTAAGTLVLEGTLFDERHPRLVRVNDYIIESELTGRIVMTRHDDRPGVIGAIGALLGREGINISSMQVGIAGDGSSEAIAVFRVSSELSIGTLQELSSIDAIDKALQIEF